MIIIEFKRLRPSWLEKYSNYIWFPNIHKQVCDELLDVNENQLLQMRTKLFKDDKQWTTVERVLNNALIQVGKY